MDVMLNSFELSDKFEVFWYTSIVNKITNRLSYKRS